MTFDRKTGDVFTGEDKKKKRKINQVPKIRYWVKNKNQQLQPQMCHNYSEPLMEFYDELLKLCEKK